MDVAVAVSDLMKSRAVDANVVGGLRLGHSLGNKKLSVLFSEILGKHRKGKKDYAIQHGAYKPGHRSS